VIQAAQTIGQSVERPWREVYEALWRPQAFPRWASGLAKGDLRQDGDRWRADGPEGPSRIRFSERNDHGVMDHWVELPTGAVLYIPLRVIANGEGAEVLLTMFRRPGQSDQAFAADLDWGRRDLDALRTLLLSS
jgi:hypothetical protein